MAGLQLGGLVSGMDTSSIVQQLMAGDIQKLKTKQTKVDELNKEKSMWTDIKLKLMEVKYAGKDLALSSTFMTKTTSSSDSNVATATAKAGTQDATYTLTNVVPATSGKVVGTALTVSEGVKAKTEGTVGFGADMGNKRFTEYSGLGLTEGTVTINGASINISSSDTLNLVATKINGSTANVKATVDSTTGKLTLEAKTAGDTIYTEAGSSDFFTKFGIASSPTTTPVAADYYRTIADIKGDSTAGTAYDGIQAGFFTLNGFTFEVKETDTVSSVIKQINSSEAGVNAVYDSTNKKFTFASKTAGESIVMENDTSNFLHSLGVMTNATETYTGTGSSYTLNGIAMTGKTNEIELDGTTINLKSATDAGETITIAVTNSSDKAVEKIKTFIEKYNAVIDFIEENSKAEVEDETDDNLQNDSSSYKNSTISKGILNGDSTARQMIYSLRRSLTEQVSNVETGYNQLSSIGITAADNESSHLTLDETTLKTALGENPDEVFKLFSNSGKEKTKTIGFTTGSQATLTATNDVNFGSIYSGSTGVALENRTFSDYSSGITSGTIKINGTSIYVSSSDTMSSVITKINSSTAGVTASFASGKFTLTSVATDKTIALAAGTSSFLYKTGMLQETSQYDGIAARVENYINPMTKYQGTLDEKKEFYSDQVESIQTWMTNYAARMEEKQARYIKQFSAMEKAMNTANSQSSWLSSQLAGLSA